MAEGKIAVITGGNRGLGRATALHLAQDGTDVVLTYRSHADEAADVVAAITALGRTAVALELDTSRVDTFEDFAATLRSTLTATWGREDIDFLVNNAGGAAMSPFGATTVDAFDFLFDAHVKGVYFLTQELAPMVVDGGRIIMTSTGLTRFVGGPWAVYASAKGAVEVLTRYLAQELGSRGITVNTVAPGPIGTDFGGGMIRDDEQVRAAMSSQAALGRVGEPDDIGGVVAALLAPGTGWITAQRIEASGGTLL